VDERAAPALCAEAPEIPTTVEVRRLGAFRVPT